MAAAHDGLDPLDERYPGWGRSPPHSQAVPPHVLHHRRHLIRHPPPPVRHPQRFCYVRDVPLFSKPQFAS